MLGRDAIDLGAFLVLVGRQAEQIAYLIEGEAEVAAPSDETQSLEVPGLSALAATAAE